MFKPVDVKPLSGFRLWLRYEDGAEGEVDLSHLAGKGVFCHWDAPQAFEQVYLGEHGEIAWSNQIDLCPDSLYLQLTGKKPEEVFAALKGTGVHA